MNLVPYMREPAEARRHLHRHMAAGRGRAATATSSLATIGSDYGGVTRERRVDQIVVNHGTRPLDDVYFDLKPRLDATSARSTTRRWSRAARRRWGATPRARYQLFRIGDAVAARNTHAAIYDALRLVRTI